MLHFDKIITVETKRIRGIVGKDEYLFMYNNDMIDKKNTVLIAIHDPSHFVHPYIKTEGFDDVLQMQFWDTEWLDGNYPTINEEQANHLRDFILKNGDKSFFIHCSAGVSRSAGIGCAVGTLLDNVPFEDNVIKKHTRYEPNEVVYRMIIG